MQLDKAKEEDLTEPLPKNILENTALFGSPKMKIKLEKGKEQSIPETETINIKVSICAYVSRHLILKEVMTQLNLKVLQSGFYVDRFNKLSGWMRVHLPCIGKPGTDANTMLFGDPSNDEAHARESVAEAVLDYYHHNRKVSIDDYSNAVLQAKQYELDGEKFFCKAFQDKMEQMVKQPTNYSGISTERLYAEEFEDNMQHLMKKYTTERNRCSALHRDIARLCHKFADLLPIMAPPPKGTKPTDGIPFKFMGNKENPSRVDELALALLDILHDGRIYEAKRGKSLY